jgi:hypothetical protein
MIVEDAVRALERPTAFQSDEARIARTRADQVNLHAA